jgi:general secretion pathway protein D
MAMSTKKSWSAIIVIFTALLMGSLSSAAWTPQDQSKTPNQDEVRKQLLDRLAKEAASQQPQPAPAAPGQQPPAPAPPATPAPPPPAPTPQPGVQRDSGKVMLTFDNADLYDFINQMASILGITPVIVDNEVKGSVSIMSSSPMSKEDVMPLFNMILKNNNAALIKQGDVYQILPISSALKKGVDVIEHPAGETEPQSSPAPKLEMNKTEPQTLEERFRAMALGQGLPSTAALTARIPGKTPPASEDSKVPRLSTNVIRVEFVPVRDLIEPIKLLMTDGGVIMPYERLNMLILTDYSDSVARILQIIHMLDTSFLDPELVDLIKIKNNASSDVVDDLKKIFGTGAKDSATGISFISLDRLNAIFVMASSKRGLEEVKRWIGTLDSESGRNIQTYVYVVENGTASNIAMMLSALYGGEGFSNTGQGGGAGGAGGAGGVRSQQGGTQTGPFGGSTGGTTQGGTSTPFSSSTSYQGSSYQGGFQSGFGGGLAGGFGGGFMGGGFFGGGQQLGPRLNVSPTFTSQVLRGGAFTGLQDTVRLVVDDVNNSLIIQSTPADYTYLLETIKKMDVLPRQAIIDARIFEVDLTDALSFGVNAALQGRTDGSKGEHLTGAAIDATAGALSANTFAFVGDSRQILMNLNALREKTKVRVLEAPSVLALDGQMARIMVGAEVPYPGAAFTTSVGGTTTSVQYRDTGISLIVMPRISASGSVTLDVSQEVSSPGASTSTGPTFQVTSVETTLSVKDGETVAIAGLIRDSNNLDRRGVPLLSEIPLVGSLFGGTTRNTTRSELIILITPHVIRTPEKFQEMTQELRDSLRHVRKLADEKEKEHLQDMEDARRERYDQQQNKSK